MNIIFFGSSKFAAPSLRALSASKHRVSCVVTQPDRHKGRGLHFSGTAIKTLAQASGIRVFQPERVNSKEALDFFKGTACDLFVVISYGQILSQKVLDIPKLFSINVHASLLPKYRGAAPISWAVINGETRTGATVIKMTAKMDEGPVISREQIGIEPEDTVITLEEKLSELAARLLTSAVSSIEKNKYSLIPQDENSASYAPKLKKENGRIDWRKNAVEIQNLVRGCAGWPGAFTFYKNKLLKIYRARAIQMPDSKRPEKPGEISGISKAGVLVRAQEGGLLIEELQMEGKRRMEARDFIAGHKIPVGERLG
ncbi:MAG: methionyl-tRNA formyltransferase [Candidatus Omnitrophica bacterium]|nr:methionyl-tRNA formyltransferase [Candidatus Omnitrophota bacterium]MDD5553386.1 methionyl-tRNA formyltransferase [Candidatus Omnitrophota bacterium]